MVINVWQWQCACAYTVASFFFPHIMTSTRILSLAVTGAVLLLAGCGGNDDGVKLGEFPPITMTEGTSVELKAPSSKSPAPFYFTSSNPAVAEVQGNQLVGKSAGIATITAGQGKMGSYNPTSTSTTATVAGYLSHGGLQWMPVNGSAVSWTEANKSCTENEINGSKGWRLPSQTELTALMNAMPLGEKGWVLAETWTANVNMTTKTHTAINLSTKAVVSLGDDKKANVTCVKSA